MDLNSIRHNVRVTKNFVGPDVKVMAVVKANAYGHGITKVTKTALNSGASYVGVATVVEGITLRENGVVAPILVLSQPPDACVTQLIEYNLMPSIYTPEFAIAYAEAADAQNKKGKFHLAVNTGMNRVGVHWEEAVQLLQHISFHRALECVGTFTHFATADSTDELDFIKQLSRFKKVLSDIKAAGFDPGITHTAGSAAIYKYKESHFDMVRLGLSIFGCHPCDETRKIIELKPAMSVHAKIVDERILGIGEGVSYGMNYRGTSTVKICTIPIGYADGLQRRLSGKIDVLYKGKRFRQVGNICMDYCMFEIDMKSASSQQQFNAQIGEEVVLVGVQDSPNGIMREEITLDELAEIAGTNVHELMCGLTIRMPIIYV